MAGSHLEIISFQTEMLKDGRQGHSCSLSSLDSFLFNISQSKELGSTG